MTPQEIAAILRAEHDSLWAMTERQIENGEKAENAGDIDKANNLYDSASINGWIAVAFDNLAHRFDPLPDED